MGGTVEGGTVGRSRRRSERDERQRVAAQELRLDEMRAQGLGPGPHAIEDSLSLRHMAANGYTVEGTIERAGLEAEMANTPGWPGGFALKVLVVCALTICAVYGVVLLVGLV